MNAWHGNGDNECSEVLELTEFGDDCECMMKPIQLLSRVTVGTVKVGAGDMGGGAEERAGAGGGVGPYGGCDGFVRRR